MTSSVFQIGLILLACVVKYSFLDEKSPPHHVTAPVGGEIRFNYSGDSKKVHWYKIVGGSPSEIYGEGIDYEFRERFSIANGSKADLVIRNIEPSDAVKYRFLDVNNKEQRYLLTVIENNFTCTIGVNPDESARKFCGPFDSISITCNISYYGDVSPNVRWKKRRANDDETLTGVSVSSLLARRKNITDNSSTVFVFSSTVQIRSDDSSEDDFTIASFVDHVQAISHKYKWKSPTYKKHCNVENLSTEAQPTESTTTNTASTDEDSNKNLTIIITVSVRVGLGLVILLAAVFILCRRHKRSISGLFKGRGKQNGSGEDQPLLPGSRKSSLSIEMLIVRGIAALKGKIYIIFQDSSFIRVIGDIAEFVKEDDIIIPTVKEPWGIEACEHNDCVYIPDRESECIWKVAVNIVEKGLTKWICKLKNPYKFSVISDGRLVVPVWPNSLEIWKSNGSIEKTIALHEDILEPYYALETSSETLIVAHGHEKSQKQRVCKVRSTDQEQCAVVWSFPGDDQSDKIGNIDQLAMDEMGRIYVTDQNKGRILLLDRDGKKICEFKTKKLPYRLCYEVEKKLLLVGHHGAVSVYKWKSVEGQGPNTDERTPQLQNMFLCERLPRYEDAVRSSRSVILENSLRLEEHKTSMNVGNLMVRGIAELNGRLNVVFNQRNFIRVYRAVAPFVMEQDKELEKLDDPFFIDACTIKSCVYVTDRERKKVLRVDSDWTEYEWEILLEEPYRLSVISRGNVLIPRWSLLSLEMYDTNGTQLNIISLPSDIIEPSHAVEISDGLFAVGHGDKRSPLHRVCMIKCKPDSSMSELIMAFGDERGGYEDEGKLNRPRSLAIDENSRVIFADEGNMRIVVLDVGWKTFASVKTTIKPNGLCYSRDSAQVFFGHFGTINTVAVGQ